jgi:general nucleoside transport system permease protein
MRVQALAREFLGPAIVLGLLVVLSSALLLMVGVEPLEVGQALAEGSVGNRQNIGETLLRMIPVAIVALSLIPSLMIGVFNIGAPGQMSLGALCAYLSSLMSTNAPPWVMLSIAVIAAAIGGAIPALFCAILRARWQINEILSTLIVNALLRLFLDFLLSGPMRGFLSNIPQSDALAANSWLPILMEGTRAHVGLLLVFLFAGGLLYLRSSMLGYRLRLFGASPGLSRRAGVSQTKMVIWTMVLAGAGAGLAGWVQMAGVDHRLYTTVADPVGQTGLFAALLGGLHPVGVALASLLFAALLRGGDFLQIGVGVSPELINTIIGLIILGMAGRSVLKFRRDV